MWVEEKEVKAKKKKLCDGSGICSMKNDPLQECERNAKDLIQNEIARQIIKF